MNKPSKEISPYPPAYVSRTELRHQLSLGNGVIDRMIAKGLLPGPLDFDGNQRRQWSEIEAFIARNNKILDPETEDAVDDIMAGIDNVTSKDFSETSQRPNPR